MVDRFQTQLKCLNIRVTMMMTGMMVLFRMMMMMMMNVRCA